MQTDIKGFISVRPGQEKFEGFYIGPSYYLQYDYRSSENRQLFTGIYREIEKARADRDVWLEKMGVAQ
jgi:hypothetical protein